jgi:hypothetical protein
MAESRTIETLESRQEAQGVVEGVERIINTT